MKNKKEDLWMENFIKVCDENYDVVFSETIDLVNRWETLREKEDKRARRSPLSMFK